MDNADKAGTGVILLLIPPIILSGAIVPMSDVSPGYLQPVYYLAISKWAFGLVGAGTINLNSRLAADIDRDSLLTELLSVNVAVHWSIMVLFILVTYGAALLAIQRKDKKVAR